MDSLCCREDVGLGCCWHLDEVVSRVGRRAAMLPGAKAVDSSARKRRTERYFEV